MSKSIHTKLHDEGEQMDLVSITVTTRRKGFLWFMVTEVSVHGKLTSLLLGL